MSDRVASAGKLKIRAGATADRMAIERLYPAAFPDEDLLPLVHRLLKARKVVWSLVATNESQVIGHIAFTRCEIEGAVAPVALLGPLAVHPGSQRQGVGSALVNAGFEHLRGQGIRTVFVLGDPGYYRRFGFAAERGVDPTYALPKQWDVAWQSVQLDAAAPALAGMLVVPEVWREPRLWSP